MSGPRALVTAFTLNDTFCADHMKLCYLWYDEVIYEDLNEYFRKHFIERLLLGEEMPSNDINDITDVIVPFSERLPEDVRIAARGISDPRQPRGYPRWGTKEDPYANYTYPNPAHAEEYAHNALLKKFHDEHGVTSYRDARALQVEGRARVAVDAVALWKVVNRELECMLQANDDEKWAMQAVTEFGQPRSESSPEAFQLFKVSVPSLVRTPWREIVRIRRQGSFNSLRERMAGILQCSESDLDVARTNLRRAEEMAVSEIIERYRPDVKAVVAETLWANIPNVPYFNPVAAYFDARDIYQEVKKARALNWFYLLRDIRDAARETEGGR